jgi:hypothetical protein
MVAEGEVVPAAGEEEEGEEDGELRMSLCDCGVATQ